MECFIFYQQLISLGIATDSQCKVRKNYCFTSLGAAEQISRIALLTRNDNRKALTRNDREGALVTWSFEQITFHAGFY